jgi:hypothetical protein
MRTSWEKLVQYVGTNYGQGISNGLQNKITVDIIEPVHSDEVLRKHGLSEAMIWSGKRNIQLARQAQGIILEAAVLANDPDAPMKLEILQNEVTLGYFFPEMKLKWNSTTLRRRNSVTNGAPFGSAASI